MLIVAVANALSFVSNALPILPLDGGRAARALLAHRIGRVTATRAIGLVNRALSPR